MKTPVVYSTDYIVYLELFEGHSFIHCDCFNWNKKVRLTLQKDLDTLVSLHKKPLLAIHDIEDNKHRKFLKLMKFEYHSDVVCTDGKTRQIFTRSL
jgi:hypothetical protein